MAQTGYTPISLYYSATAAAVPTNSNLANGELAINITDGKLYYKDNTGTVKLLTSTGSEISPITNNGVVYINSSGQATSGSALTFDGTNFATTGNITSGGVLQALTTVQSSSGADLSLNANGANRDVIYKVNATELMRLVGSTGYLGIGTSSPSAKLDIAGSATAGMTLLQQIRTGTGNSYGFQIKGNYTTEDYIIQNYYSGALAFGTNNTERMRLDSAGNLGLGVTPSASSFTTMQIRNASLSGWVSDTSAMFLTANASFDGTNFRYISTNWANQYRQQAGAHYWYNAPSGTAGTIATLTQAMTLDASGNLGVGTSSVSGNGRLELNVPSGNNTNITFYENGSSRWLIGSLTGSNAFRFYDLANATERLRIASNGAWGLAGANYGTAGQVLTSNGSGAAPSWQAGGGGGGSAATPTSLGTVYGSMTTSGASPYLTALGYNAGAANTGARNVFIGVSAGQANLAGGDSIAIGYEAMKNYTESNGNNIAIGTQSLSTATSGSSYYNIAIGHEAMKSNTSGYINTAVGWRALFSNTTGRYSTAVGYQALYLLQSGNDGSTAVGANAGSSITTGIYNVMVGGSAIASVTTGGYNTAMGYNALGSAATTSSSNTAFGYNALAAGGVKDNNVAIGRDAMVATSGGANNVAVGREALAQNTTSANNVSVGYQSLYSVTNASGNHVAVGYQALYSATDNSNVAMGYRAGYGVTSGHNNVLIGTNAGNTGVVLAGGAQNVVIGADARTNTTGAYNEIVIGQTCNGVGNDYVTIGKLNNRVYNHYDTNATWTQSSDVRLKTDIQDDSLGLSFINKLRPVKYRWKATNELELDNPHYNEVNNKNTTAVMHGLIAQEVKAALDEEGVSTFGGWDIEPNGIQGISREMFITPLINAIQELTAQVETLKAEIATLKGNV